MRREAAYSTVAHIMLQIMRGLKRGMGLGVEVCASGQIRVKIGLEVKEGKEGKSIIYCNRLYGS